MARAALQMRTIAGERRCLSHQRMLHVPRTASDGVLSATWRSYTAQ